MIVLVQCIVSLFYDFLSWLLVPRDIFHTAMAWCSLFVLKVPLNTNQLTNLLLYSVYYHHQYFWLCLTILFFSRDLQVRPGFPKTSDRRTLRLAGARFLYRSDAFPVTETSSVKAVKEEFCSGERSDLTDLCVVTSRLRNDLYCVEWDVKLYYTIPYRCYSHRNIMPQTTVLSWASVAVFPQLHLNPAVPISDSRSLQLYLVIKCP